MTQPAILYLVHRFPYPPDKGDRIRTFHLLKYLSGQAAVHLACLAHEPVASDKLTALQRYCARVAVVPLGRRSRWVWGLGSLLAGGTVTEGAFRSAGLRAVLREWGREVPFQACLASASSMAGYLRMPELQGVPAVVDLTDVDSQKWLDYAAASRGPRAWLYRTEGRRLRRLEQALAREVRGLTLVSEAEVRLLREFCPNGTVWAVPNGVDQDYFHACPPAGEQSCVFVGQLDYRPNVDGACWFCREVWPLVRRAYPQARVYLVGRQPVAPIQRLAVIPGVEVVGEVPDVRPYLARAAVTIAPLQIARGVQNKVLEALAMSRAIVATPQALAGLHVKHGVHVLEAATVSEWVEAIRGLFEDEAQRRRLGEAGRRYVDAHHHWDRCLEPFGALLGLSANHRHPEPEVRSPGSVLSTEY